MVLWSVRSVYIKLIVMNHLEEIGVKKVTDIYITHHHCDQAQGLHQVQDSVRILVKRYSPHFTATR